MRPQVLSRSRGEDVGGSTLGLSLPMLAGRFQGELERVGRFDLAIDQGIPGSF
jgi:hypothetical protein